ncbi:MAG: hypothetical protein KIT13_12090 [Burkholderiales bacterium]|nr:hypothetical protein [Burkholderiales bacterium]
MIVMQEMFRVFQQHRGNAIVIPGRGNRQWHEISTLPSRDLPLGDPAMGGHAGFALGLALALPREKIVLFDSEGDLQMSLGVLAMISEHRPKNFYHFLLDNECYATTGGQPVPNAANVAYDQIARAAGYPSVHAYTDLEGLSIDIGRILAAPGPVFVAMKIVPEIENRPMGQRPPRLQRSREQVLSDFRTGLGIAG